MNEDIGNRVAFLTLGCKLNYSESSALAREFVNNGYVKVSHTGVADIYVINTCSVTEHADKKCRTAIRKLHKQNPDAIVAVTGCYAQLKPQEILDIEGVDLVLGADEKSSLFIRVSDFKRDTLNGKTSPSRAYSCAISEVETIFPAYSSDDRTRSFLKVQDGCDYHCTYCTIPLARGRSRNHPVDFLVKEAQEIAARGVKEIVLTGVNTGDFGKSTGESFISLIDSLVNVKGIERIRVSSVEPNLISEEFIKRVSTGGKLLPHFHIPLQSGCDRILALMKRRYNRELFKRKIDMIREIIPFSFIGVDVIVGFPSESDSDFKETFSLLEDCSPSFLHVFPYSKRGGTPAASYPDQVPDSEKSKRVKALTMLSESLYSRFVESNRGREEEVLFESTVKGGKMLGFTRNYIKIERPLERALIGEIVKVVI